MNGSGVENSDMFLLELGVEEIPAGYIEPALKALSFELLKKLDEAGIEHGRCSIYGTPRRLAIQVTDVARKQKSRTAEIMGPPAAAAFDGKGNPTVAAEKFAEKSGVSLHRLILRETKKGPYVYAKKTERGLATRTVLKRILPDVILSLPFPKTMRWADLSIFFARPIHSILAVLGNRIVSFELGTVRSGNFTRGHRFMNPKPIQIFNPGKYVEELAGARVLADIQTRKSAVQRGIAAAAAGVGGHVLPDEELVDIVTNLVEYPVPVTGRFDEKFLELPKEVLVTAMREHQKYFAVIDDSGRLLFHFIAVNDTLARDPQLVARGHERVIRARLEDASFFYHSDLKTSSDDRVKQLKGVLFQARLGSMHEKVLRVQKLTGFIAEALGLDSEEKERALRAAYLCKADLVSQVVTEFPKLQGIMGRIYALSAGEDGETAAAIEEHYRPTFSGGPLPETTTGAIVGVADKMDSICGCFTAGLVPTGTADPYALRRQGIGIIQIFLKMGFSFSLKELIQTSIRLFEESAAINTGDLGDQVHLFLQQRISYLLGEQGYSKDLIAATVDVSIDHIPGVWQRVRALESMKAIADFDSIASGFKRVANIIRKARHGSPKEEIGEIREILFEHDSEAALYAAYLTIEKRVKEAAASGNFEQALRDMASIRPVIDTFFDGTLVMAEDQQVRENRLTLLEHISSLFGRIADFSKIST